jgi:hypothetical protein
MFPNEVSTECRQVFREKSWNKFNKNFEIQLQIRNVPPKIVGNFVWQLAVLG